MYTFVLDLDGGTYLHQVAAKLERIPKAGNPEKARRVFVNTMDAESFEETVESTSFRGVVLDLGLLWARLDRISE